LFMVVVVAIVWAAARAWVPVSRTTTFGGTAAVTASFSACIPTVIALVALPLAVYVFVSRLDMRMAPVVFVAPAGRDGWQGPERDAGDNWKPDFVGDPSQWHVAYQGPAGHNVEMVAIGYSQQAQGQELVNEENSLLGAGPLAPMTEAKVTLDDRSYIELVAGDPLGHRTLVWSVYDIGGRPFVTPLLSQLWYGLRSLGGAPYSVMFAFRAACTSNCDGARNTLKSFVRAMGADCFASVTREPRSSSTSRPL
jgi:EpsI family protein